jgi:hypothetical protein
MDFTHIGDLRDYAQSLGGKCLSDVYNLNITKYQWECSKGHTFSKSWQKVKDGSFCFECHKNTHNTTIDDMRNVALSKGGKCLSTEYKFATTKYDWECREGHTWSAEWGSIKKGSWCLKCYRNSIKSKA